MGWGGCRPDAATRAAVSATLRGRYPQLRGVTGMGGLDERPGERAERVAEERIRAALPAGARCHSHVTFLAKSRPADPAHDGEADLVIVDPDRGLLVIEVKSGRPRREGATWFIEDHPLTRSPFDQAMTAKHDLGRTIEALPAWTAGRALPAAHAVAFPDVDLASLPRGHTLLGPDVDRDIVIDADALATPQATRAALDRVWAFWAGEGARPAGLTAAEVDVIDAWLAPSTGLHRLLRHDINDAKGRLLAASRGQLLVLNHARSKRRVEVVGPAGSGKSLVAIEKARRLAAEGWRTLFVCFNQPLATAVLREVADLPAARRPVVSTFHRLCERLGVDAGVLEPRPVPPTPEWWNDTLPNALLEAVDRLPDERFGAIVVDEGQDFEPAWLESLEFLFLNPEDGVFWVFHDPGQALAKDDRVGELGLERLELFEDWRSPTPVADVAARFYRGPTPPEPMSSEGRAPEVIEAAPGADTVDAVRLVLHRLIGEEGVRSWQIAVLSGTTASKSDVWRVRQFGNAVLWNGAIDDAGLTLGLAADAVPEEPGDVVLFETIRRFKGLEREVVILCELPVEGARLDQLLYTGLTRATTYLVIVTPPELAGRFRPRPGSA